MDKNKVLYIAPFYPPDYAGGARLAHSIAQEMDPTRFIVYTKSYYRQDDLINRIEFEGVVISRVKYLGRDRLSRVLSTLLISFLLIKDRRKYKLIHFIGIPNEVVTFSIIAFILRKKMISTMELVGDDDLQTIADSFLGKLKINILRLHSYIGGLSLELLEKSKPWVAPDKLIELPNAIEIDKYIPVSKIKQKKISKGLGIDDDLRYILWVGALGKRKGLDLVLKFIRENKDFLQREKYMFLMLGPIEDSEYTNELNFLEKNNVIKLIGTVPPEDVIGYFQISSIFVFPSRREGFGRVALEALATGLPVLVSDIPPMQQIINHDKNGLMFKCGDYQDFEDKLKQLLLDKDLRARLSDNSRDSIELKYQMKDLVNRHQKIYKELGVDFS